MLQLYSQEDPWGGGAPPPEVRPGSAYGWVSIAFPYGACEETNDELLDLSHTVNRLNGSPCFLHLIFLSLVAFNLQ